MSRSEQSIREIHALYRSHATYQLVTISIEPIQSVPIYLTMSSSGTGPDATGAGGRSQNERATETELDGLESVVRDGQSVMYDDDVPRDSAL